jgi:O-methyltransferase involved in polyketide biosynthesis
MEQSLAADPGAEMPLTMLPYFRYLNKNAQRSLMRQLIDQAAPGSQNQVRMVDDDDGGDGDGGDGDGAGVMDGGKMDKSTTFISLIQHTSSPLWLPSANAVTANDLVPHTEALS